MRAVFLVAGAILSVAALGHDDENKETRRGDTANFVIVDPHAVESSEPLHEFMRLYPCPDNMSSDPHEPCPGWVVDHVIPLECGGRNAVSNLQWLRSEEEACASGPCKQRYERLIYCK